MFQKIQVFLLTSANRSQMLTANYCRSGRHAGSSGDFARWLALSRASGRLSLETPSSDDLMLRNACDTLHSLVISWSLQAAAVA